MNDGPKRIFLILLALAVAVLSLVGCKVKEPDEKITSEILAVLSADNAVRSDIASAASEGGDESAERTDDTETLSSINDINEIPYAYLRRFAEIDGYVAVTNGATVALGIEQKIENRSIKKGDMYYTYAKSSSIFVKTEHTAYFYGDKAAYRDKKEEYKVADISDYLTEYGVYPATVGIEGYIINNETVLSVARSEEADNTFIISLDGEKAGLRNKLQMKKHGDLADYPVFKSVALTIALNEDLSPVSVRVAAEYSVSYGFLGYVNCKQDYTVVYSEINGAVEIPSDEIFDMIK